MTNQNQSRPKFGQRVKYSGFLLRTQVSTDKGLVRRWDRIDGFFKGQGGRSGLFIGTRTLQNGRVAWINDDFGNAFFPDEYIEVWLIVPAPNRNPIYVLPDDVEWIEDKSND